VATARKMKPVRVPGKPDPRQEIQQSQGAFSAPAQTLEGNSAETSDPLTDWPSPSFGPVSPDVLELLRRAGQILKAGGFLPVDDPSNPLGDGKSWVLTCEPTSKPMTVANSASSARRCLESEGVKVDEVYTLDQHDRTFEVALSPPSRPIAQVETYQSEGEKLRSERLRKGYQFNHVGSRIPSNRALEQDYMRAHNGEKPSTEYVLGQVWKRANTPTPTGVTLVGQSGSGTELPTRPQKPQQVTGLEGAQIKQSARRKFRSKLREAIAYYIDTNPAASDREILAYLREHHRTLIPREWNEDEKLAGDTFTKVRRVLRKNCVNGHVPATSGKVTVR